MLPSTASRPQKRSARKMMMRINGPMEKIVKYASEALNFNTLSSEKPEPASFINCQTPLRVNFFFIPCFLGNRYKNLTTFTPACHAAFGGGGFIAPRRCLTRRGG